MKVTYLSILTLLLLIATLPNSLIHAQSLQENSLSPAQLKQDFEILKSSLLLNHPDLYLYSQKEQFDSFFIEINSMMGESMNSVDFFRILTPILGLIRNNHTDLQPPKGFLNKTSLRFPFSFYHESESWYVLSDASDEYYIKEGQEILSINGVELWKLKEAILPQISTDGFNKTLPERRFSKGFSRYYAYYLGLPESYEIQFINQEGVLETTVVKAIPVDRILENQAKRKSKNKVTLSPYSFEYSEDFGILTVSTFSPDSGSNYKKFLRQTFQEIDNLSLKKIILDLRNNLGGFPEASNELLTYFIKSPVYPTLKEYSITNKIHFSEYFVKDKFYQHFNKLHFESVDGVYEIRGAKKIKCTPKSNAFQGAVFVLINSSSASTTGQLLGLLKEYTNSFFIGEEAGGNPIQIVANDILTLILPNSGIQVKIPFVTSKMNINFKNIGKGILPDLSIRPKIEEVLQEKDIIMTKAIEYINQ